MPESDEVATRKSIIDDRLSDLFNEVSADQLMEYNRNIAQWIRLSGSDEEREAFDYIASVIEGWGVSYERFNPICLVSLPGPASLRISGLDGQSIA